MVYRIPKPKSKTMRRPQGFNYTSGEHSRGYRPCLNTRGRCKTQIAFEDGQTYLRLCEAEGQPGPLIPVNSGVEAAAVAREACDCFDATGGYECDSVPAPTRLGGGPAMVSGANVLGKLPGLGGIAAGGFGATRKRKKRKATKKVKTKVRKTRNPKAPKWVTCRRVGKLTAAKEKKLPDSAFGVVEGRGKNKVRKYPMPDPGHARSAKARASAEYNRKKLSKAKRDKIFKKADRVMAACRRG
jgi:hypothetical protein